VAFVRHHVVPHRDAQMSTRQTGNKAENEVCRMAEALGYATFCARGSRGSADIVAFESAHRLLIDDRDEVSEALQPLVIQCGTTNKPIAATLVELDESPRPIGSLCIVSRRHRAKNRRVSWTHHTLAGKFATLAEALDART
jgi:hypothetical protein